MEMIASYGRRLCAIACLALAWASGAAIGFAESPTAPAPVAENKGEVEAEKRPAFIRVTRDADEEPLSMDTAVVTFAAAAEKNRDVVVDLIGAVHVGDGDYYQKLNKLFETYDVLLYELVAPEGTRVPKGGRKEGGSAIGSLQGGLKSVLDLEFQLEQIDYTKENFVHADMSPDEFAKSMKDRGESVFQIILRAMGQSAAQQATGEQGVSDVELLFALLAKDRAFRLKRIMAKQFENMETAMSIFEGPAGSTIITERNKKCFEVLQKEIDKGHRRIGIFYGAGHLADMEARLVDDFGLKRAAETWLVAWDLNRSSLAQRSADDPRQAQPRPPVPVLSP